MCYDRVGELLISDTTLKRMMEILQTTSLIMQEMIGGSKHNDASSQRADRRQLAKNLLTLVI